MARTLEELIILKRTALRYLLLRESKLLSLGKSPVNKKIANFVKNHHEDSVWSSFLDSLNEDLTRNINIFDWKLRPEEHKAIAPRKYRLDSVCRDSFRSFKMHLR
ncbi:hypothetical protein EVAR_97139_1 [Eumeta japonica]|nr:hypothetical protein EVAR_97139_1 [Eumeta japonica]